MNIIAWPLGLSVLMTLMLQAISFHKATVCRQEAWLKSVELRTRELLPDAKLKERDWHLRCHIHFLREQELVTWQRLPMIKKHTFELDLDGKL